MDSSLLEFWLNPNQVVMRIVLNLIFVLVFGSMLLVEALRAEAPDETVLYTSQAPLQEQNPDAEPVPEPQSVVVPTAEVTRRYVVLLNGSILFGDLKLIGDQYEVTTQTGTRVIPQSSVSQIAVSLRQIYVYKASQVFVNDLEKRSELLRWCFQYELLDEAAEQLELLKKYVPNHPIVEVFERRMAFLKSKKEREQAQANQPENASAESVPRDSRPTFAELQRFAETIPEESIEIFRKKVQPILQNNCMMADCHGPNSETAYRLLRISPKMGRGEIIQNLYASVRQINLSRPELSPLLRKPVTPHGKEGRAVFVNQDYATYQILIAWTYLVAQNRYVIPRERLIPPQKGSPVFTPTQRGLVRVSSHSPSVPAGPCQMWGVAPSLYPQNLYPDLYPQFQNPVGATSVAGGTTAAPGVAAAPGTTAAPAPQFRLLLPGKEDETGGMPLEPTESGMESGAEVLPASAETDSEREAGAVQQVSGEESERTTPETDAAEEKAQTGSQTVRKKGKTDWNAVVSSFGEALGETAPSGGQPETEPETAAAEATERPASTGNSVPESRTYVPGQSMMESPVYVPGQSTMEGPVYAPGQSSISRVYAPGESSAENLKRGNPSAGVAASPVYVPAPQSPATLMNGRDSVEHGGGSYNYGTAGASAGAKATPAQTRTHVWEQMLEMQGGLKNE